MILKTVTSVLYNLIVLTSFVHGYIYFAAHLDDLENVAKKLAPDGHPVERAKPIIHPSQQETPEDELRVDYYEEVNPVVKDYRAAPESPEDEDSTEKEQGRKVLRGRDTNIDELAKKIKDRVLKELADEFIRLKKQRKKNRQARQRNEKTTKHRNVKVEREKKPIMATTPKASVIKREKHVPVEEEQVMPTTNRFLIGQSLNTKPKDQIEEQMTERMPVTVQSDEFEIEKIDLGHKSNDSYEYYEVPQKDEIVFEAAEEATTSTVNMVRYKIQSNNDAEMPMTTKFGPELGINANHKPLEPNYVTENLRQPMAANKFKGNDDTYVMYEVASEEEIQTQGTTRRTTLGVTQKLIRMTRPRYSMTSPNYYASLPTIAERYDFNEPIPNKDRVRSI